MQCITTAKQPNQLAYCYETKKSAINLQIVKAKDLASMDLAITDVLKCMTSRLRVK